MSERRLRRAAVSRTTLATLDPPPAGTMPDALSLDLLAAVIASGASPESAVRSLSEVLRDLGQHDHAAGLRSAAHAITDQPLTDRVLTDRAVTDRALTGPGLDASTASGSGLLRALGGALSLAARSGLPPADLLRAAAQRERVRQSMAARAAIRRLEVLLVIPAGLCLLPAFVLLGILPVVIALFG